MAEPWARWRNDFAVPAQRFEKAYLGIDRLKAVQQQDRATDALAHDFELDPSDLQPLAVSHHTFLRGLCEDIASL
jgi:hypothetical protein